MDLREEAYRGEKAKAILESEVFKDSMTKLQQSIFDRFAETAPSDTQGLLECRLMLKLHADFVRELVSVLNSGKLASFQLRKDNGK